MENGTLYRNWGGDKLRKYVPEFMRAALFVYSASLFIKMHPDVFCNEGVSSKVVGTMADNSALYRNWGTNKSRKYVSDVLVVVQFICHTLPFVKTRPDVFWVVGGAGSRVVGAVAEKGTLYRN